MEKTGNLESKEKHVKLLKPKQDIVFQRLFNKDNKEITKSFVEALLEKKVGEIIINDEKALLGDTIEDKTGILDLELDIDNKEKVDVEIQLVNKKNFTERLLFYFCKLYIKELERGSQYQRAKKVVIIAILDYELENTKEIDKMETLWNLREKDYPEKILTDKIEIRIISLNKVKKEYVKNNKNKKAQWLMFLDDPNSKEVFAIMEKNEDIKEAVVKVRKMSRDEAMQRLAFHQQVAMMDAQAREDYIKEEGIEQGKMEIIKRMLAKGKSIEEIADLTDIDIETVRKVANE